MKLLVESQLVKIDRVFRLEYYEENSDDHETKDTILDDDGDEELIQGGGEHWRGRDIYVTSRSSYRR